MPTFNQLIEKGQRESHLQVHVSRHAKGLNTLKNRETDLSASEERRLHRSMSTSTPRSRTPRFVRSPVCV